MAKDVGTGFRKLHRPGCPFILANAWDRGSAKMLVALGAKAIGTSSAAHAFTLGRPDMGGVTRDEALSHAADLVAAVAVPVSGDFENGFGEAPETCAETVRLAAEAGLAGISIEDTDLPQSIPYPRDLAIERIHAAASAARALPNDFMLIARADGVMNGHYDMQEAMARCLAFEAAGADGLYVPMPPSLADIAQLCAATRLPVNALIAGPYTAYSWDDFAKAGVARLSLGSTLARAIHRVIHDTAQQMFIQGDFSALQYGIAGAKVDALLTGSNSVR